MNNKKNKDLLSELLGTISAEEQSKSDRKMILAAKIANAIKAKGLKKSEFAEKLGKQPSEISKWISGTHNFTVETLIDIERVLSIQLLNTRNLNRFETYEKFEVKPKPIKPTNYRLAS